MPQDEWFKSAFSDDYIRIYAHRDQHEAREAIRRLTAHLPLHPNGLYLDLCCGFARHLDFLNSIGVHSVGCDLSMDLMAHASPTVAGRLTQANMLNLPYRTAVFDGLFSFFTSFGYFDDDNRNAQVIHEMGRVLKVGGHVLIDFLNPAWVRNTLVPYDESELPDFHLTQRRWIDETTQTVNKEITVNEAGVDRTYRERVKLYDLDMFKSFFKSSGLTLTETMGDTLGAPLTPSSTRQILIAVKQ